MTLLIGLLRLADRGRVAVCVFPASVGRRLEDEPAIASHSRALILRARALRAAIGTDTDTDTDTSIVIVIATVGPWSDIGGA